MERREEFFHPVRVNACEGLEWVFQMIPIALYAEVLGRSHAWLSQRYRQMSSSGKSYRFTPDVLPSLNDALRVVAERLRYAYIDYIEDRDTMVAHVNEHLTYNIRTSYICMRMGKDVSWYHHRSKALYTDRGKYQFTRSEVAQLNLIVADVRARLMSLELTLD